MRGFGIISSCKFFGAGQRRGRPVCLPRSSGFTGPGQTHRSAPTIGPGIFTRRIILARIFLVVGASLSCSDLALGQEKTESTLTPAQLEELLDKASALSDKYKTLFRDLTAEEKRVFELYKNTGELNTRRQTVSDLIVYSSQRDPNQVAEYRNIREVDGKPVKKQLERVEKLFDRVSKADSPGKELDRINRESARYDLDTRFTGYTILNAFATWKKLR